jgi:hypothetical protein
MRNRRGETVMRFVRRFAGILALVAASLAIAQAEEPPKGLEGLGFSVVPKEGGKARTSLFGAVGEGFKFVYVFDRSASMGGSGQESLRVVKTEFSASLKSLDTVHQFQIISYNERPTVFNPSGSPGRLAFATEKNKERAIRFVESIKADGGTEHKDALKAAIRLKPDAIFFLTDADDPKLSPAQLEEIQRMAAGIRINAIEFGAGPKSEKASFLADLARQNGGDYVYVDVTRKSKSPQREDKPPSQSKAK